MDYAVDVCNAVLDIMQPTTDRPMIINLPVTVEMSMPHVYANQIEYCDKHLKYRDSVIISTHPHNDRGTGVACAELAVLAGAQRVECCLFGNGERTGNVDAVTLAMNMYSHGVDPKLDFSDMPAICATYERALGVCSSDHTPSLCEKLFSHLASSSSGVRRFSCFFKRFIALVCVSSSSHLRIKKFQIITTAVATNLPILVRNRYSACCDT